MIIKLRNMTDDSKKIVLGDLYNRADATVKKVISSYKFDQPYKVNMKALKAHPNTVLESGAVFLKMKPKDEQDKKLYQNKDILSDRIILRIEALFEMECGDCNSKYQNQLDIEPLLRCQLCLQGIHDCQEASKKVEAWKELEGKGLLPTGGVWLCTTCLRKNNFNNLGKVPVTKSKPAAATEGTENGVNLEAIPEEPDETPLVEEEENGERDSPRRNRGEEDFANEPDKNDHDHMKDVCPLYLKQQCPHGLKGKALVAGEPCKKKHPPRCRRYCSFGEHKKLGCRKGRTCKYWHPKLCKQSELMHKCMNKDCNFIHLRNTKRPWRGNLPEQGSEDDPNHPLDGDRRPRPNTRNGNPRQAPPPVQNNMRRDSAWSDSGTPCPPTVNVKGPRVRKDSISEKTHFLVLLEEMKKGLLQTFDDKITSLTSHIPKLIQENMNKMERAPGQRPAQVPQMFHQVPMQMQAKTHPPMVQAFGPMAHMNPAQFQSSFF